MLHLHLSKHELLAPVRMRALATVAAAHACIGHHRRCRVRAALHSHKLIAPLASPLCRVCFFDQVLAALAQLDLSTAEQLIQKLWIPDHPQLLLAGQRERAPNKQRARCCSACRIS